MRLVENQDQAGSFFGLPPSPHGRYVLGMDTKYHQYCSISMAMEVVGERWTLLVVRELLVGSRRFNDIARGLPAMSRSMLTKRLRHLEAVGLVERLDGAYLPTEACEALRPALHVLGNWADKYVMQDPTAEDCDAELLMWWAHSRFDTTALPADRRTVLLFHFADVSERLWTVTEREGTSVCFTDQGFETDAVVRTDVVTLHRIFHQRESINAAVKAGRLRFEGKPAITRRLPKVLNIEATGLLGLNADGPGPRLYR